MTVRETLDVTGAVSSWQHQQLCCHGAGTPTPTMGLQGKQSERVLKSKSVLFVWLIKWKHFLLTDPFLHSFSIALLAIFKVFSIFLLAWLYWMMGWGWTVNTDWFSRWVRAGQWSPGTRRPSPVSSVQSPVSRSQPKCVNVKEFPRSQNILYITTFKRSFLKILSFIIGKRL